MLFDETDAKLSSKFWIPAPPGWNVVYWCCDDLADPAVPVDQLTITHLVRPVAAFAVCHFPGSNPSECAIPIVQSDDGPLIGPIDSWQWKCDPLVSQHWTDSGTLRLPELVGPERTIEQGAEQARERIVFAARVLRAAATRHARHDEHGDGSVDQAAVLRARACWQCVHDVQEAVTR